MFQAWFASGSKAALVSNGLRKKEVEEKGKNATELQLGFLWNHT